MKIIKLIIFGVFLVISSAGIAQDNEIVALKNESLMLPFLWATDINDQVEYQEIVSEQLQHPLTIGRAAFTYLYSGIEQGNRKALKRGFEMIQTLEEYPFKKTANNATLYLYPDDYQDFKGKEWWSGMANSIIASSFLLAYEIKKDEKLKEKAIQMMNGVIQPLSENGCALEMENGGLWYLEYADIHRNDSSAYFVHNGFLYALIAIKYFEHVTGEEKYKIAFEKGILALEQMEQKFFYSDDRWTYYMQHPRTIESLHYAIFEIILLQALLSEIDHPILSESLIKRRKIIVREYGLYRNQDGSLFFHLMSAPHFYWQDLYPTRLINYYSDGSVDTIIKIPRAYQLPVSDRLFYCFEDKSSLVDSVVVFQDYCNRSFKLVSLKPKKVQRHVSGKINAEVSLQFQGRMLNDHTVQITNEKNINRTMLSFSLPYTVDLYNMSFFGILIRSEVDIESIMINLVGSYAENSMRYYIAQPRDKLNLILLKGLSFGGYEDFRSKRIKEIQLNFYYRSYKGRNKKISFSDFFASNDPSLLYRIMNFEFGQFNFEEKLIEGNIY